MAAADIGISGQRRKLFQRLAQLGTVAGWQVAPPDGVTHQRIARKHGVRRNVTHAARGVAGRVQHRDRHFADLKCFTVFESLVHFAGNGLIHHEKRAVLLIVRCKRRFRLIGAHRHTEHLVQAVSLPNVVKMAVCQQNSLHRIFFDFI